MARGLIPPLLALALLGGGCALAPGLYLSNGDFKDPPELPPGSGEAAELEVTLIPISPALLKRQAAAFIAPQAVLTPEERYEYLVGPQDVLRVVVWEHPELMIPAVENRPMHSVGHRVNSQGNMFYPHVGVIQVAGKSTDQIRKELSLALAHHISNPQLDVRVVEFNSQRIYVSGQLKRPGKFPITDVPVHVADAINAAGGATEMADMSRVVLTRKDEKITLDLVAFFNYGDSRQNLLLRDGDILYVPENTSNKVYVMGEVKTPTVLPLHDGRMTLAEALSTAGIDQNSADPSKIYILRYNDGKPLAFHLDAERPDTLILATAFMLEPLDIVFVSTAGISRWNRVLSQMMPTVQTIWTLGLMYTTVVP